MIRTTAATLACLVAFFVTSGLAAQEGGPRTPADLKQLNDDAFAAAGKGDLDKAVEIWRDMVTDLQGQAKWDIHANIAVAYRKLKKFPEAWHHLRLYMINTSKGNAQAGKDLKLMEDRLKAKHIKVTINCDPTGAAVLLGSEGTLEAPPVTIDGAQRGGPDINSYGGRTYPCPLQWWFLPGTHQVTVVKGGYISETHDLLVKNGGETQYLVTLGKPAPIIVKKPIEVVKPPVKALGAQAPVPSEVEGSRLHEHKTPKSKEFPTLELALVGAGAAMMLGGVGMNVAAMAKDDQLRTDYPPDNNLPKDVYEANQDNYREHYSNDVQPLLIGTYVLYGIGAAAAITGGVLFATQYLGDDTGGTGKDKISFGPLCFPHGAGATLEVTW